MLEQNLDITIDTPIYYFNKLMNNKEYNYTTIEKEALAIIYVVKNLCIILLGNNFIFSMDP